MFRVSALPLLAIVLVGCGGRGTPTPAASPATATPSPAPSPTASSPRPTLTPGVNAIIDAVLAHDAVALERLTQLTPLLCGPQEGLGSPPPCPGGQNLATTVDVLPIGTCEGELLPASAVRDTFEEITRATPLLTGVYRAPDTFLPGPKGEYVAVFSRQMSGQTLGVGVIIGGNRVIGLWFGCGANPSEIVPPGTPAVLLPGG